MPDRSLLVTLELLAVAAFGAAAALGASWPVVAAAGIGALTAGVILAPVVLRMGIRMPLRVRGIRPQRRVPPQAFDVRCGGDIVGIRWNGTSATAVVSVTAPGPSIDLVSPHRPYDDRYGTAAVPLQLDAIAESLHQFDIHASAIDVVSHVRRLDPVSPLAAVYDRVVGPLPVATHRATYLVLRIDAADNPGPIARRGGAAAGAGRTAAIAVRRLADRLRASGHVGTVLTAAGIDRAEADMLDGFDVAHAIQHDRALRSGTRRLITYSIRPEAIPEVLATCWRTSTDSITTVLTLRPGSVPGNVVVTGLLRHTTTGALPPTPNGTCIPDGCQHAALGATVPIGAADHRNPPAASRIAAATDLRVLVAPPDGSGQLLGADPSGIAVFARLFGPSVESVSVTGDITLIGQIVLRAIAIGARTVVHTDRPDQWRHLAASIADSRWLLITATEPGRGEFDLIVLDGIAPRGGAPATVPGCATVLTVEVPGTQAATAAVSIRQSASTAQDFVVMVAGRTVPVSTVTIPAERAWLTAEAPVG